LSLEKVTKQIKALLSIMMGVDGHKQCDDYYYECPRSEDYPFKNDRECDCGFTIRKQMHDEIIKLLEEENEKNTITDDSIIPVDSDTSYD